MPLLPNENTVSAFPYTKTGTLSNSNPDQNQADNFHGFAEELFLLTVAPGQIVSIRYLSDTVPAQLILFNNSIDYLDYCTLNVAASSVPVNTTIVNRTGSPPGFFETSVWVRWVNSDDPTVLAALGGLYTLDLEMIWVVPAGITTARISAALNASNNTWPDGSVPQDPTNYSIAIALVGAPARPANAAY